ncbi:MAG: gamma-glutamyl-gamma-aminobutyrate hydrolase family protein [Candidatus Pelethousia sp.]|nr:gamma-glutamyl-gamma-aminobutyrate hydrolase family protein [Candidatus Pelethousia sp.]
MGAVIGIVPTARLFDTDDPYKDQYIFVNNYGKRILENGGIPLGILSADGKVAEEALELCQGFLLCGGSKLWPYHLQVVEHAVRQGKPILGICLGMQAICAYFRIREEAERRRLAGDTLALFEAMKQEKFMFNLPVAHHWDVAINRSNIPDTKHPVNIRRGTYLYRTLGADQVLGATLHRYRVNGLPKGLTLSATTADGTIEGIEKEPNILGVQFHPEVEEDLRALFVDLLEKSCRYKGGCLAE